MTVLRVTPNLDTRDPAAMAAFYRDVFEFDIAMDMGWIATLAGPTQQSSMISVMTDGGSGQPTPVVSIEVDDLDEVLARAADRGMTPAYGPVDEPWGVRRAMLPDPDGNLINVLVHL